MTVTTSTVLRGTGLAAIAAGLLFAGIQPFHPPDVPASVGTNAWVVVQTLKLAMCGLFLLGTAGLYARQAERVGWPGLVGALVFGLSWALQVGFVFVEAFVLPPLASAAPAYVAAFLAFVNGTPAEASLGLLPAIYGGVGVLYLLGGTLFGFATFRAGLLPRAAGLLLAVGTLLPVLGAPFVAHPYDRIFAIPVGLAFAWLGFALSTSRRTSAHEAPSGTAAPPLRPSGTD